MPRILRNLSLTLAALAAAAGPALAQNAVGDGRALDANLRQGSGGVNEPAEQPDYRLRNNIITGNVTGLGYFRDRVGYRAPGEFGDVTSDDELFRFRARTFAPTGGGVSDIPYTPIYRNVAPTTAAQVRVSDTGQLVRPPDAEYRPGAGEQIIDDRMARQILTRQPVEDTRGMALRHEAALDMEMTASPLLGVRGLQREDAAERTSNLLLAPLQESPEPPVEPNPAELTGTPLGPLDREAEPPADNAIQAQAPAGIQRSQQLATPALELGFQIRSLSETGGQLPGPQQAQQRAEQVESQIFRPLEATGGAAGNDTYLQLLSQIRQAGEAPQQFPGAAAEPADDALAAPSPEQMQQAQQERQAALRSSYGFPPAADVAGGAGGARGAGADPDQVPLTGPLARTVEALRYELPPLATLAGSRGSDQGGMLSQGEEALQEGRYLDAEAAYRRALQHRPGMPMARVGLIHSQIGAGLLRSAAVNLRSLLERHPELISARYSRQLLPQAERLAEVRSDLEAMMADSAQATPAILLAYLGHQLGQPEVRRYALDVAQAREPRDPLVVLLRRVWLEGAQPPATQPAVTPAPGETPE